MGAGADEGVGPLKPGLFSLQHSQWTKQVELNQILYDTVELKAGFYAIMLKACFYDTEEFSGYY